MAPPVKPLGQKLPALHGRLMVDTINGRVRVRAWPKKRGPNVPPQVRIQNERFTAAQRLARSAKGIVMNRFMDATKKTGLYPRDLFTKLCLAPPIAVELEDGRTIVFGRPQLEACMFQGFRLQRTSGGVLQNNISTPITWDDPIIDTAAFWDISAPGVVTIPEGVQVMEFTGGIRSATVDPDPWALFIRRASPDPVTQALQYNSNQQGLTVTSGPIIVAPGEQWSLFSLAPTGRSFDVDGTFFTGTILAAQV